MAPYSPRFWVPAPAPEGLKAPGTLPPLVTLGNPSLALPSSLVAPADIASNKFQERLAELHWKMVEQQAMGIAAPQIGWYQRVFQMVLPKGYDGQGAPLSSCWINPEIVAYSPKQAWCWEGCLSVPGLRGWLRRAASVQVRALDAKGEPLQAEFNGWEARSFQHEFDHLEGILFPYRLADPRHMVRDETLDQRQRWPPDWPAPGAASQPFGQPLLETTQPLS